MKTKYIVIIIIVIVLAGGSLALYKSHVFSNNKATSGVIPAKHLKGSPSETSKSAPSQTAPSSQNTNTASSKSSSTSQPSSVTATTQSNLLAPFGNFVSNHNPQLSGSLSNEGSVCNTTPGAKCYIQFTQNGVIKTLPVETADSNGSVFWSWNVSQSGFTTGKWQIEAIATLDGQSKTTTDPIFLTVSQ